MKQKIVKSNILLPLIEDTYRNEYSEYKRRNLRFSDAGAAADGGEKCEREIYYDMTIPDKKSLLSSGTLVLFDDGRLHEQDIRRRLRLILKSPEREVFDDKTEARGKIDNEARYSSIKVLIEDLDVPEEDPVLEIKSVNEFSFQEMARSGEIDQTYYDQVQYYLWKTKKRWAIILIKNRNDFGPDRGALPFLEFVIHTDPERQKQIRAGLRITKDAIEQGILPPRPFERNSRKCQYCRFKHECWPNELQEDVKLECSGEEAPSEEILSSAIKVYAQTQKELKELEKEQAEARDVIEGYFRATGQTEILSGTIKASYSRFPRTFLDKEYLINKLGQSLVLEVSIPQKRLLLEAMKTRKGIDAAILEEATKAEYSYRLNVTEIKQKESQRISKPKKGGKNDKGNIRTKKTSKTRASKTRDKKEEPEGSGISG